MEELGEKLAEAHAQSSPQLLQEAEKRARALQAACARKVSADYCMTEACGPGTQLGETD